MPEVAIFLSGMLVGAVALLVISSVVIHRSLRSEGSEDE